MNDTVVQICLAVFGVSAIILVSLKNKWALYSDSVLSHLDYYVYTHKQWGYSFSQSSMFLAGASGL